MTRFVIEPLAAHDRTSFNCGVEALNRYFREQVTQDVRRRLSNCFVAVTSTGAVASYYTLASASVSLTELAEAESRRLPRYKLLPAGLIGRLAVDLDFRGQGLGAALVVDAIGRAARAEPMIFALIVDAKDESAAAFYAHLGFRPFESRASSLYLPLASALRLLRGEQD